MVAGIDRGKWAGREDEAPNPFVCGGYFAIVYGVCVTMMGPGSMMFHASMTEWGSVFDNLSMVLFTAFVIWYDVSRIWPKFRKKGLWTLLFGAQVVLITLLNAWLGNIKGLSPAIFGVTVAATLAFEILVWINRGRFGLVRRNAAVALSFFAIALFLWIASGTGSFLCDSDGDQGHLMWHIGSALTVGLYGAYFRTENNPAAHLNLCNGTDP